jgi:hypothetical protein
VSVYFEENEMKRSWTIALSTLLLTAGVCWGHALSIKEIMVQLNKGQTALTPTIKHELQAATPNWPDIQRQSREYVTLATALGGIAPPMGDRNSWQTLTKQYGRAAEALNDAVGRKDKQAALAAHGLLTRSCQTCHRQHRP